MTTVCIKRPHSVWTTCTCPDCLVLRHRLEKLSRCGSYRRTSSAEAWVRLDAMLAAGWTAHAVASASGLPVDTMQSVLGELSYSGRRQRFGPSHAAAIVNAGAPTLGRIGVLGSRRRLQALSALGHGTQHLADVSGLSPMAVSTIRGGKTASVTPRVAALVAAAFEQLAMTRGASERARVLAAQRGWVPPLAWDSDAIDDPAATTDVPDDGPFLDEVAITEAMAGRAVTLTRAERTEAFRRLLGGDLSAEQIAQRLGYAPRSVVRTRSRLRSAA